MFHGLDNLVHRNACQAAVIAGLAFKLLAYPTIFLFCLFQRISKKRVITRAAFQLILKDYVIFPPGPVYPGIGGAKDTDSPDI